MTPEREAQLRKLDGLDAHDLAEVWALVDALRLERDFDREQAAMMRQALRKVISLAHSDVRKVAPRLADRLVHFCRESARFTSILRSAP